MIIIDKLYSETNLILKDIDFQPGINIILGKYSKEKEKSGVNGIGKSSVVRLISFCFLSDKVEKFFGDIKYHFLSKEEHSISLDFKVNSKKYTIKRYFNNYKEIYFGTTGKKLELYTKSDLKIVLGNLFFKIEESNIFFEGNRFGTLIQFFLKDDIDHHKRIDPFGFLDFYCNKNELIIYNFFLLGLPTKNLISLVELIAEYDEIRSIITGLEKRIAETTGKNIKEFKSEKNEIENKIKMIEENIKSYRFKDSYIVIENEIIKLTSDINLKIKEYHACLHRLNGIRDSYKLTSEIDTVNIKHIYNDALKMFGDMVKKSLDEVQSFKRELLSNRAKYLSEKENQLSKIADGLLDEISSLENKRSKLYKFLEEKGALDSITNNYEILIEEKVKIESSLQLLIQIEDAEDKSNKLDYKISKARFKLTNDLTDNKDKMENLSFLFQDILKNAIFYGQDYSKAFFDISKKPKVKVNETPYKMQLEMPKLGAFGRGQLRLVAYDFMVFLNNIFNQRKLPSFLIHDGVYHGISRNTTINCLNYMNEQCKQYSNIQYIITFNEDEITIPREKEDDYGKLRFDLTKCIVAEYEDIKEKMIFKREVG